MKAKQPKMKKMKLSDIKVADYNPRYIDEDALEGLGKSISEFGLVTDLVWNQKTKTLVGGHQRLKALVKSGYTEAEVKVVNLSKAKEKALNLTLNNGKIQGEYTDSLQDLLREVQGEDPEMFEDLLLDGLLATDPEFLEEKPGSEETLSGSDRCFVFTNDQEARVDLAMQMVQRIGVVRDPKNNNDHGNELASICGYFLQWAKERGDI